MKYKSLNYYNNYRYKINDNDLVKRSCDICFGRLYNKIQDNNKLKLYIYICKDDRLNDLNGNHYCYLTRKQINNYLKWIEYITGVKCKIKREDKESRGLNSYCIYTDCNVDRYTAKLLPALIRNMYEFPFNMAIKSAFILRKYKDFSNLEFSERLSLCFNSIQPDRNVHSTYPEKCEMVKDEFLKTRLKGRMDSVSEFIPPAYLSSRDLYFRYLVSDNIKMIKISESILKNKINPELMNSLKNNLNFCKEDGK